MHFLFWIVINSWIIPGDSYYHEMSAILLRPPSELREDSFFGYSIAYEQNSMRLLVGAPRADTVGHVYSCNLDESKCNQIKIINDELINRIDPDGHNYSNHDIWLGATVKAGQQFYVVCAPRYVEINNRPSKAPSRIYKFSTFSRCYTAPNATVQPTMMTQIDMADMLKGATVFENITDSFGWSVEIDDNHVLIGGPAMSAGRVLTYLNPKTAPFLTNGFQQNDITRFNFGYSVAAGNFFGSLTTYAISSPYGELGKGKISFFYLNKRGKLHTLDVKRGKTIVDQNLGSLFGASLCSAKLSCLERSDLLVGAPAYVPRHKLSYDIGAVYVYSAYQPNRLSLNRTIYGMKEGGHFGSAIANAGDLDGDGTDEIVIAAPYENGGRGAIYLYSGADLVTGKTFLQRIEAKEDQKSFGLSLTPIQDYDKNGCNELAVGAPGNDSVILFRCIASITVTVFEEYGNLQDRANKEYFVFKSCMNVTYPEKLEKVYAEFQVTVAIMHQTATFQDVYSGNTYKYSQVISENQKQTFCKNINILTPQTGDYTKLIGFTISAKLIGDPLNSTDFEKRRVTLSSASVTQKSGSIWAAECKGSSECNPVLKLAVSGTIPETYVIGSSREETLNVAISNSGDTAYCACVKIRIIGVRVLRAPPMCKLNGDLLTCKPNAPIKNSKSWETEDVKLETKALTSDDKKINIFVDMFKCCQDPKATEQYEKIINLTPDSKGIDIKGSTNLGDVVKMTKADDDGKNINHIYEITNNGLTNWVGLKCSIMAKKQTNVDYVSAMVYRDELGGFVSCEFKHIEKTNFVSATCDMGSIAVNKTLFLYVSIYVSPKILDEDLTRDKNVTLQSNFTLFLGDKSKLKDVKTTLVLLEAVIPIWIIVVATLVGLVILILIAVALYETGFLRRKNKEKLKRLRKSVHRQSMRRSMMREGPRASADRRLLVEITEEENERNSNPLNANETK